jgi:hypothetical protein
MRLEIVAGAGARLRACSLLMLVLSAAARLSAGTFNPFIYFRF